MENGLFHAMLEEEPNVFYLFLSSIIPLLHFIWK